MENGIVINGVGYRVVDCDISACNECALRDICERIDGYRCLVDVIFGYRIDGRMFVRDDGDEGE